MDQNIQMVDLKGQYSKIQDEIDDAVINVIRSAHFINGPQVQLFCNNLEKYLSVKKVIPCANGTDALQIAMMALDLQAGDEVIIPAFTYVATAEVVALLGLTPIWVDVDPMTFNIDTVCLERAISPKTKAVVPVHLYGQCADMEKILEIARKYGLKVIEDTAQSIGAVYTFSDGKKMSAGTIGDIGTTSFFPSKNLGCYGDGGALYTNNENIAHVSYMIANHGQKKKYYHEKVGINSRLDTIQAVVLNIKLKYLDTYISARQNAASIYDSLLSGISEIQIPCRSSKSTHVFHQYTIIVANGLRDGLKEYLESKGIPVMIYYPYPMHLQEAYISERYQNGAFPVSERLSSSVLSLPMHTELTFDEQVIIADNIRTFLSNL